MPRPRSRRPAPPAAQRNVWRARCAARSVRSRSSSSAARAARSSSDPVTRLLGGLHLGCAPSDRQPRPARRRVPRIGTGGPRPRAGPRSRASAAASASRRAALGGLRGLLLLLLGDRVTGGQRRGRGAGRCRRPGTERRPRAGRRARRPCRAAVVRRRRGAVPRAATASSRAVTARSVAVSWASRASGSAAAARARTRARSELLPRSLCTGGGGAHGLELGLHLGPTGRAVSAAWAVVSASTLLGDAKLLGAARRRPRGGGRARRPCRAPPAARPPGRSARSWDLR